MSPLYVYKQVMRKVELVPSRAWKAGEEAKIETQEFQAGYKEKLLLQVGRVWEKLLTNTEGFKIQLNEDINNLWSQN